MYHRAKHIFEKRIIANHQPARFCLATTGKRVLAHYNWPGMTIFVNDSSRIWSFCHETGCRLRRTWRPFFSITRVGDINETQNGLLYPSASVVWRTSGIFSQWWGWWCPSISHTRQTNHLESTNSIRTQWLRGGACHWWFVPLSRSLCTTGTRWSSVTHETTT